MSVSIEEDEDAGEEEKEKEKAKEEKKSNRRSVSVRMTTGILFTNETSTPASDPAPPRLSADDLIRFNVTYPLTLVPVGAVVPINISVTNLPSDISELSHRKLTAEIRTPMKVKEVVEVDLQAGVSEYTVTFVCAVGGIYKAMVTWKEALQNKPCRVRAGEQKSKKRAMNMNRSRDTEHAPAKDADVDAEFNPMRPRKRKEGGKEVEEEKGAGASEVAKMPVGKVPSKSKKSSVTPVSRDKPSLNQAGSSDDIAINQMKRRQKPAGIAAADENPKDVAPPLRSRAATTVSVKREMVFILIFSEFLSISHAQTLSLSDTSPSGSGS